MKIAYFLGTFFPAPGGVQVQTHNIANTIVNKGNEIDFFLFNKTNVKNNRYGIIIINKFIMNFFFYLNYYLKINLSFLFRLYLKKILKIENYDLFHFHFLSHKSLYLIDNLHYFKKKIIVTFHGADIQINKNINYGYRLDKFYNKLFSSIIIKVNYFFSISETIKKDIIKIGIKKSKIYSSPNSVSLYKTSKFKNFNKDISKKIHLITVTRFAKGKKGLDMIPKIAEILINKKINFKWTLVGKNMHKINKFKNMNKYKRYFKYYGNIQSFNESIFPNSKLIKIYKNNHLFVSLSRIEALPITFLEALACKLPILSFNSDGGNEIVTNNLNGKLINEFSPKKMAKGIIFYKKNNDTYKKHTNNTIKSILRFDLEKIASSVLKDYKNIIKSV